MPWRRAPSPARSQTPCVGDRPGPERALARHCESREAMERHEGFDEAAHAMTAERLAAAVEERGRPARPLRAPARAGQ